MTQSSINGHIISIDNKIIDKTVINFPIILIKGTIINDACQNIESVNVNVNNNSIYSITDAKTFKTLLELNVGENYVAIKYCCSVKYLNLFYKPFEQEAQIQPLYIINRGHNGLFQAPLGINNDTASALNRINLCCQLLQTVIAEKLYESGYERKTFSLKNCVTFHSKLDFQVAKTLSQTDLWRILAEEVVISETVNSNKQIKYIAFLGCTTYNREKYLMSMKTHEDFCSITDCYVAIGGGDFALIGTPCLYALPHMANNVIAQFGNTEILLRDTVFDDSAYRGTVGACFSTIFGSILHEFCHILNLGHTKTGIMSRGFDNIYNIFLIAENGTIPSKSQGVITSGSSIRMLDVPKELLNASVCVDDTYFTKSCISILACHKFLNNFESRKCSLTFDKVNFILKSTLGIKVIELRRQSDEMVLESWCFKSRVLKYTFQFDINIFKSYKTQSHLILFAIDSLGNIINQTFMINI